MFSELRRNANGKVAKFEVAKSCKGRAELPGSSGGGRRMLRD